MVIGQVITHRSEHLTDIKVTDSRNLFRRAGRVRRPRLQDEGEDPDYRFSLANERTFLAWIRTALALVAGGVALDQLASRVGSTAARLAPSVALIVLGTVLAAMSHRSWRRNERAMRLSQTLPGTVQIPLLAYGSAVVAATALILVLAGR